MKRNNILNFSRLLSLSLLFLFLSINLFSQQKKDDIRIRGIVMDSLSQELIGYATIAVLKDSTKAAISVTSSDVNGKFTIKVPRKESYNVYIGFVGYTGKTIPVKSSTDDVLDIGTILLKQGVTLDEVNIVAQQPLITSSIDKITYNMEADPEAATSSTLEILRKVPMISIDGDDNVTLNGETNYKVLVNGRSSTMMSKNFKEVIKSMPANSIKNIEVITNPSTKYDSEGIGGLINIITNRSVRGFNGSVNTRVDDNGSLSLGTYLAAQFGKFAISANISAGEYADRGSDSYSETENFLSDDYKYSKTEGTTGKNKRKHGYTSVEASYEIDSLNLITLSGWGYLGDYGGLSHSTTQFWDINDVLSRQFTNISDRSNNYGGLSGSLNYQKLFKKKDKTLTFSYNIDNNPGKNEYTSEVTDTLNYNPYKQYSKNESLGIEHTTQVDFYNPIDDKHQYEMGAKYILRRNVSDTEAEKLENDQWIDDSERINDLDYDQHIGSLYAGYVFKHKKFTAKGGVRGELAFNDGVSKSFEEDIAFETDPLFNFVPYVNLSYNLKKGQNILFSYTQRIQRPGIWHLNPFVDDSNPIDIRTGNPDLESVVANALSLNYRKSARSWNFFAGFRTSLTNDAITSVSTIDENGVKYTTYENIGTNNSYRLNLSGSYRLGVILNLYANANVAYTDIKSKKSNLANSGFTYGVSAGGGVQLWKDANFNLNAGLYSPHIQLQGESSSYHYHSLGLSQKFLKKKLTFSASVRNPFERYNSWESDISDDTFKSFSSFTRDQRSFNISLNYRFGKVNTQIKKTRRSIKNDDKMSGGGSGGGGASQGSGGQ